MNNLLQMLFQQKMNQIPKNLMNQLENQLKASNPQAFQEFQQARKNNVDANEYLNNVINKFTPEQKEQWGQIMSMFNQKK